MLDINFIRENPEEVKRAARNKGMAIDIDRLIQLDVKRRELQTTLDDTRHKQNELNAQIKDNPNDEKLKEQAGELKRQVKELENQLEETHREWQKLILQVPNIPEDDVPIGEDESANKIIRQEGEKPGFHSGPRDYLSIAEENNWIDMERGAKVAGSRFGYIKGKLALMEFALVQFALHKTLEHGFKPIVPPVMIRSEMMRAMGYVDTQEDKQDRYFLEKDDLYLVGTSEQSIGPMHADETFPEKDLPLRYVAFSTCFRREAGSYGKDTKGILRVHQFDKVEMFSFTKPENSREEHKKLLSIQEELMQELGLPYQVVHLSTGDIAQPAASTIDIETWLPGQNEGQGTYRETHSTSNTTSFQARRLNIKYQPGTEDTKADFVHMLNGTAFAIGRMLIAIIENYQQEDGTIEIPEVLKKYMPSQH